MASDMKVHAKQKSIIEFLHVGKKLHSLTFIDDYRVQTVNVGTVTQWVMCFSITAVKKCLSMLVQAFTRAACSFFTAEKMHF